MGGGGGGRGAAAEREAMLSEARKLNHVVGSHSIPSVVVVRTATSSAPSATCWGGPCWAWRVGETPTHAMATKAGPSIIASFCALVHSLRACHRGATACPPRLVTPPAHPSECRPSSSLPAPPSRSAAPAPPALAVVSRCAAAAARGGPSWSPLHGRRRQQGPALACVRVPALPPSQSARLFLSPAIAEAAP